MSGIASALPRASARDGEGRDAVTALIAAVALAGLAVVPWAVDGGATAFGLIGGDPRWPKYEATVSLVPLVAAALVTLGFGWLQQPRATAAAAGFGVAWAFGQGLVAAGGGPAFGVGAALVLGALTICLARALARLGLFAGNITIATIVVTIALLLTVFIFYPVGSALVAAVLDARGHFAPRLVSERLFTSDIWGMGCLGGGTRCGVAINSALLAAIVGTVSTLLGLVLALVVQRGGQRYAGVLKVLSILPIITPPFVIALALVVLFGRTGLVTGWLDVAFGIGRSRWIYG
ncbi:MAG: hypothetical protein ABI533_10560, partial [Betaproteobacteria bacterium]